MRHALAVLLLLAVGSAQAAPVTWTFQDVVFDDGGTLTGSFIFDVDSDTVVNNYYYWTQAFYFDVAIDTTRGDESSVWPFDIWEGWYRQSYVGEEITSPGNPPLPTADPANSQNGLSIGYEFDCVADDCYRGLELSFGQPLTNAGGVVALTGYELIYPFNSPGYSERFIVSGSLVGTSVIPIPAAVWLFGSGLGLLGWLRRRKAT